MRLKDLVTVVLPAFVVAAVVMVGGPPATAAPAPTPAFSGPLISTAVGVVPTDVAIGDLNSDGVPDVVTADGFSTTVSVLIGSGDGRFSGPSRFSAALETDDVTLGDLDGDGRLDLVATSRRQGKVVQLRGDGQGNFFRRPAVAVSEASGLALIDVDADGDLDAVTTSDNRVVVLPNDQGRLGTPRFGTPFTAATDILPEDLTTGDLNGDGRLDLGVVAAFTDSVHWLLADGAGGFTPAGQARVGLRVVFSRPTGVAIGDVNGDGRADLVTADNLADTVSVLTGFGDGTFAPPLALPARNAQDIALGDVNGDRRLDIVVTSGWEEIRVLYRTGATPGYRADAFPLPTWPRGLALTDVNADGRPDVVTGTFQVRDYVMTLINTTPSQT